MIFTVIGIETGYFKIAPQALHHFTF